MEDILAISVDGNEYAEYVLAYTNNIMAISIDATVILKSMEGGNVKYENDKIEPPEMFLGLSWKNAMTPTASAFVPNRMVH